MKELLESMNKTFDQLDKISRKTLGVPLEEVMNEKDTDKLDKYLDVLAQSIIEDKNRLINEAKSIKRGEAKELDNGQHFKIYEATTGNTKGVIVDTYGAFGDLLYFGVKGIAEVIKQNKFAVKDLDGLYRELMEQIKEIVEEN